MVSTSVVNFTGYKQGGSASGGGPADLSDNQENKDGSWTLEKCIQAYTTYLDSKTLEIQEQQNARRYRHGAQWTSEQIKTLNDRRQPVVTYNKIGRKIDGIRWHRVRLPDADEVEVRDGIPCTTVSRTLVDMAGWTGWSSMRRLVEQAAILRMLDVEEIDRVLAQARRRGAPRLRTILAPWRQTREQQPLLRSRLEARLLPLLIEEGLPAPRCNVKLRFEGRLLEIDLFWEEQRLAIETDGEETHGTQIAFQRDRWRDQLLVAAGYRTARVTWAQVRDEPNAVVDRIARTLKNA